MLTRFLALLLVCLPLALCAPALAQDNPFGPIPQTPPEQAPPAPSSPAEKDDGLSDRQQLLIALAGIALLTGIAAAIIRDARRSAPEDRHSALDSEGRPVKGSRKPPKQRVKQNRAKAKTARQARKRNR